MYLYLWGVYWYVVACEDENHRAMLSVSIKRGSQTLISLWFLMCFPLAKCNTVEERAGVSKHNCRSIVFIGLNVTTCFDRDWPSSGHKLKVKVIPQLTEVAQRVPGRLRPRIFLTIGTTRVVGRQPYAPAAFTPGEIPGTHFQVLSRPQGTWFRWREPRKKSPVTSEVLVKKILLTTRSRWLL